MLSRTFNVPFARSKWNIFLKSSANGPKLYNSLIKGFTHEVPRRMFTESVKCNKMSHSQFDEFTPCDISDGLLNKYKVDNGGYLSNLTQWSGQSKGTVHGKAYTVLFAPANDPRPSVNYIDVVPEGSFLVIALTRDLQLQYAPYVRPTQAIYGGLMSTRAQYLKAAGTLVFARIRDLQEHRGLDHPVFSYGLGSCAGNSAVKPVAVNVHLEILTSNGEVEIVRPGDYIVGDVNGVVRVPSEVELEPLISYVRKSVEVDDLVSKDIKEGRPAKQSQRDRRTVLKSKL